MAPELDQPPEVGGELVDLVSREEDGDLPSHRLVSAVAAEILERNRVEVGEKPAAEILEPFGVVVSSRK